MMGVYVGGTGAFVEHDEEHSGRGMCPAALCCLQAAVVAIRVCLVLEFDLDRAKVGAWSGVRGGELAV